MHFKIGLASVISCLAFVLGLFAFTGIAWAHSTNLARGVHPEINIDNSQVSSTSNCVVLSLSGSGFTPSKSSHHNHALLSTTDDQGDDLSIDPSSIRVSGNGNFSETVNICGFPQSNSNVFCFRGSDHFQCQQLEPTLILLQVEAEDEATGATSHPASLQFNIPRFGLQV